MFLRYLPIARSSVPTEGYPERYGKWFSSMNLRRLRLGISRHFAFARFLPMSKQAEAATSGKSTSVAQPPPPIIRRHRPDREDGEEEAAQPLVPGEEEKSSSSSVLRLQLEPEMPSLADLTNRDRTVDPSAWCYPSCRRRVSVIFIFISRTRFWKRPWKIKLSTYLLASLAS